MQRKERSSRKNQVQIATPALLQGRAQCFLLLLDRESSYTTALFLPVRGELDGPCKEFCFWLPYATFEHSFIAVLLEFCYVITFVHKIPVAVAVAAVAFVLSLA